MSGPAPSGTTGSATAGGPAGTWQAHCLTGPYREVAMALFALPRSLVERRWYLLLLDSDGHAGVFLFTRAPDGDRVVSHEAAAPGLGDLPATAVRAAVTDPGSTGAVEALVRARHALVSSHPSIAPISTRGAFGRPFDSLRGRWARALVLAH